MGFSAAQRPLMRYSRIRYRPPRQPRSAAEKTLMRAPIPENLNTVREAIEREGEELFGEEWTGEEWREHASAIKELQADPPEIPNFVEAANAPDRRDACVRLQCAYNSVCRKLGD